MAFRRIQAADLVGWEGEQQHPGVEQLVEAVSRVAGPPRRESPEREEEDEPPLPVPIEPEPEGQAEAIHDETASEEETALAELEAIHRPEDVEPEPEPVAPSPEDHVVLPETPPEEEAAPPEKPVPAGLERWIKEPKRLALVAAVAGLVVIALVVVSAILNGESPNNSPPLGVASIEIDPAQARIAVDSRVQLTATLRDLETISKEGCHPERSKAESRDLFETHPLRQKVTFQ